MHWYSVKICFHVVFDLRKRIIIAVVKVLNWLFNCLLIESIIWSGIIFNVADILGNTELNNWSYIENIRNTNWIDSRFEKCKFTQRRVNFTERDVNFTEKCENFTLKKIHKRVQKIRILILQKSTEFTEKVKILRNKVSKFNKWSVYVAVICFRTFVILSRLTYFWS